jgi:hypothetical protein
MGKTLAGGVQIVAASKDGKTSFWFVAMPRERALKAMREMLAPGWSAVLTDHHITAARVIALEMRPNSIREIGPTL